MLLQENTELKDRIAAMEAEKESVALAKWRQFCGVQYASTAELLSTIREHK